MEYATVLILVASIVAAALTVGIPGRVADLIEYSICRITSAVSGEGECELPSDGHDPRSDEQNFTPPRCEAFNTNDRAGYSLYLGIFKFGEEYAFMEQQMADGTYRLTLIPHNAEFGVEGKLFQLKSEGGDNVQLGAEAKIGAYLKGSVGDTWVFDDKDQAHQFKDDIVEHQLAMDSMARNPGMGLYYWLNPPPEIPDPGITVATARLEAGVNAEASAKVKTSTSDNYFDIGTGLRGKVRAGTQISHRTDNRDPDNPLTGTVYQVDGQFGAGTEVLGAGEENLHNWSGAVRVMRNEEDEPVEIIYVTTVEEAAVSKDRLGTKSSGGGGGLKNKEGESVVQETRTTITLDTPEERAIAEDYLSETGVTGMPALAFSQIFDDGDDLLTEPPDGASEFERLMYEQATVVNTIQDKTSDNDTFGGKIALGLGLGAKIYTDQSEARTVESEYLGPPQEDGTREFGEYPECLSESHE